MAIKEAVKHSVERTVSVISVLMALALIGFLGWSIYVAMVKPHTNPTRTMDQRAAQIINPTYAPAPRFGGCASMRVYEYYRKEKK